MVQKLSGFRTRTQAQSAAAMCPQDQRMACVGGWSTMLLLMRQQFVAASLLHVCQDHVVCWMHRLITGAVTAVTLAW